MKKLTTIVLRVVLFAAGAAMLALSVGAVLSLLAEKPAVTPESPFPSEVSFVISTSEGSFSSDQITELILGTAQPEPPIAMVVLLLVGLFGVTIPFCIAIVSSFLLMRKIDRLLVFTAPSVRLMTIVTRCAGLVCAVCAGVGLPLFWLWADYSAAPGLIVVGLSIVGAAFIVTMFASLLKRLLKDAIALQTDADLTI